MQIIGLDISKGSVSACLLTEKPTEHRQFYYDCDFYKFEATAFGIRGLLTLIGGDLANTIAVMEPTGVIVISNKKETLLSAVGTDEFI